MQERLADRLIDWIPSEGLTGAFGELLVAVCADRVEGVAPGVAHRHATATGATDHEPLQQGGSLADGSRTWSISIRAIVV